MYTFQAFVFFRDTIPQSAKADSSLCHRPRRAFSAVWVRRRIFPLRSKLRSASRPSASLYTREPLFLDCLKFSFVNLRLLQAQGLLRVRSVQKPPLCKGGWRGAAVPGGLSPSRMVLGQGKNNPSVNFVDSSLYTREPFALTILKPLYSSEKSYMPAGLIDILRKFP